MSTFIKIGIAIAGSDSRAYCVSKSQLQKQLSLFRMTETKDAECDLAHSDSKVLLQFDTKSCQKLNKRHLGFNIRLVIILRSESRLTTLGPFILPDHGAETCFKEIRKVILNYNLENRITGIVCDTENTNTGHLNGVCVRIEEFLERDLFYFLCRHHIYDLILKHVGEFLFGRSTGPTFDYGCTKLKRVWENLCLADFVPYDNEADFDYDFESRFRENALRDLKMQDQKHQTRDDYAELTDLALKFFGESDVQKKNSWFLVQ